jgi:hypothetical protein
MATYPDQAGDEAAAVKLNPCLEKVANRVSICVLDER